MKLALNTITSTLTHTKKWFTPLCLYALLQNNIAGICWQGDVVLIGWVDKTCFLIFYICHQECFCFFYIIFAIVHLRNISMYIGKDLQLRAWMRNLCGSLNSSIFQLFSKTLDNRAPRRILILSPLLQSIFVQLLTA